MANEKKSIITILADTTKYEQSIESLKWKTRELHSAISSSGGTVDVDTSTAERKLWKVKGEVKDLRWAITTQHALDLKIDDYQQKIRRARNQLKDLDSDTDEARSLRLNIMDYQRWIWQAKKEFKDFENQGVDSIDTLKWKVGQLWRSFESLKWWIETAGKALMAYQALQAVTDVVMSTEETAKQLINTWVSVKDANTYSWELKMIAADSWFKSEVYNEAYMWLVQSWLIDASQTMHSSIWKAALMIEKGWDMKKIGTAIWSLQQNFGYSQQDAASYILWMMTTPGMKDVTEIPDYLAEYAVLAKERGMSWDQLANFLMTASKQNTFNLDKPLDLIKEQGARYSDIFTRWDEGQLKTLNSIFWEEFWSLRKAYLSWEMSIADVSSSLAEKAKWLSSAKQLQLVLDVFGTQSEDLGAKATLDLFNSIKSTKGNEGKMLIDNANIIESNRLAYANSTLTQKIEGTSAAFSVLTGKVMDWAWWSSENDWKTPKSVTQIQNTYYGSDVKASELEKKLADMKARLAK